MKFGFLTTLMCLAVSATPFRLGAFEIELRYLPFWECPGVDIAAAEQFRVPYYQALKDEAILLLKTNRDTVIEYQTIYSQEISRLEEGDPDRQGARQHRQNLLKAIQSQDAWKSVVDFYEMAAVQAHHVQMGIDGLFQWSCAYPQDAETELLRLLGALEPSGIEVISGGEIIQGIRSGLKINEDDGMFHYIDLDRDIRPLFGVDFNSYSPKPQNKQILAQYSRIFQIEALIQRDYFRAKAFLGEAQMPMPILDMRVPEGIRQWWIFRPTVKEIVLRDLDATCKSDVGKCLGGCPGTGLGDCAKACVDRFVDCASAPSLQGEVDFWAAMREALLQIGQNIDDEKSRIEKISADDIEQLLELPQIRLNVLASHSEYSDINCIVMHEWTEKTLQDFRKQAIYVEQGVLSLAGGVLTLTGNVPVATLCFLGASALGIPQLILVYQEYKEAEQGYFTAVTGYGLYPRELYASRMLEFNLLLAQSIVDGIFTLPQAWKLYQAVLGGKIKVPDLHRLARLVAGSNPKEAQALTSEVLSTADRAASEPAKDAAEQVTRALDQVDPVVQVADDVVPNPSPAARVVPDEPLDLIVTKVGRLRAEYPRAQPFRIVDEAAGADGLTFEKINDLLDQFADQALKNGKPEIGIEVPSTFYHNPTMHIGEVSDFFPTMAAANVNRFTKKLGTSYYIVGMKDGRPRYIAKNLLQWLQSSYLKVINPQSFCSNSTVYRWLSSGEEVIGYGEVAFRPPSDMAQFFGGADKLIVQPLDPLFEESGRYLGKVHPSYFLAGKSSYPTLWEILQEFAPRMLDVFEPANNVSFYLRIK